MNAPTLLVGLGGAGCKIIERVSQMVTVEQRNNIAFAVFDTDINELRGIQQRNPFIKIIQTSTKQTVGEYLKKDTNARDAWFPVNGILNAKTLTEGAGQVRSISRLALESVIRAGKMEPLHEAIQSLYKVEEDKADQALRVVIVSSLAGGTGSGLILPVALYIRNYLQIHFRHSANITRGFFVLPEVFYEVIRGQAERNNLKANAYATLRELDAFLMKGDGTLPARYASSVRIQFPRAASEGYEEFNVRPYDFCFLFDAQNADGSKLNSHDQYLDHAANCIYAQSIGPMNKRSNSSEDNTVRKLAKERGRNRYAGAGASMLIYPYEDIRTLIALNWAKQCISKQWLAYDEAYKEIRKEMQKQKEQGLSVTEQPLSSFYANQVETDAKHDIPFASAIFRATGKYEDGVTRSSDGWTDYVNAVLAKIVNDLQSLPSNLQSMQTQARTKINGLENDWPAYAEAYLAAKKYRLASNDYVEGVSQTIAYSMFGGSQVGQGDAGQEHRLEKHLVGSDGQFMHPNAVRYMLIKIYDLMKAQKDSEDQQKDNLVKFFDGFEKNTFDDKTTEEEETVDSLTGRKLSIIDRWLRRPSGEQEDMKKKFRDFFAKIGRYHAHFAKSYVLDRGIKYIKKLIEAYDIFYKSFDAKVEALDKDIRDIYKRYSATKGTTVHYVCASKKCLDQICERRPYTGSTIVIDSDLARGIYMRILTYAQKLKDTKKDPGKEREQKEEELKISRYFSELFDKEIIGYFEKSVTDAYGGELNVDVITAIENEALYEGVIEEGDGTDELTLQYVRKVIGDTRKLSCPFIERHDNQDPINSCTFNDSLRPARGDDSPRGILIKNELMNYGGEPDPDIDKNMIMFYQSFYGLRANDLSKFAPPVASPTYDSASGEYFTAYYELVSGIYPKAHLSKEISPHIDKWWHIVTKMPDLDEENQKRQEYDIYAAFFWAIVNRFIYLTTEGADKQYKLKSILLKMDDDALTVSNGTECDKLYEVLDAIAIYPELVRKILSEVRAIAEQDAGETRIAEEGMLFSALKSFTIEEPGIGEENLPSGNIFDIPLLMKKSSTPDIYCEADMIEMLRTEILEIKKYLSGFCTAKELPEILGKFIMEQFEGHLKSVELESRVHPTIYRESLFDKTCDTIAIELMELGLRKEAKQVKDTRDELRKR